MKALFIWSNSSKEFLVNSLLRTKQFSDIFKEGIMKKEYLLCSQSDWTKHRKIINNVRNIYILVELDWVNDLFYGYELGLDILKEWKGQTPPTIQFISAMPRQCLYDSVEGKNQHLVKVFNHLDLLKIQNSKLPTFPTEIDEWNFYKNYALTGAGILDDFMHRLHPLIALEQNKKEFFEIVRQLKSQSSIVGVEVTNHLSSFDPESQDQEGFIDHLKRSIEKRKLDYDHHKLEDLKISQILKVMIIEDNLLHLNMLKTSLLRFFSEDRIHCFSKGQEAIDAYESNPKEYNLIFLDLELLEGNFYQRKQGLHVLKTISDKGMSAFTVITGLGRKGVQELLQLESKKIVSKKQLYEYDTDTEVNNMLRHMTKEFKVLEQRIFINFGPRKSYFGKEGFRTTLSEYYSIKEFRNRVWEEAFKTFNKFKTQDLNIQDWPNKSKSLVAPRDVNNTDFNVFIEEKFSTLLAHRLIFLYLASLTKFELHCDNDSYFQYTRVLNKNRINLIYGHLNKIALVIKDAGKTMEGIQKYWIKKEKLFPEEIVFIQELEYEKKESLRDILLKNNSPDLFHLFSEELSLAKEHAKKLPVKKIMSSWTISDLVLVINTMFQDILEKEKESYWFCIVEDLFDSNLFTNSIELELEKYIPTVSDQVGRINDIFIKVLDEMN